MVPHPADPGRETCRHAQPRRDRYPLLDRRPSGPSVDSDESLVPVEHPLGVACASPHQTATPLARLVPHVPAELSGHFCWVAIGASYLVPDQMKLGRKGLGPIEFASSMRR